MQADLEQIPAELKETLARLLAEHQRVLDERDQIQADKLRFQSENKILREQLRLLRLEKYGPRSEKLSDGQLDLLDKEPSVVAAEVEKESSAALEATSAEKRGGLVSTPIEEIFTIWPVLRSSMVGAKHMIRRRAPK